MKRKTVIILSIVAYVFLIPIVYLGSKWYVDKKEDKEWSYAITNFENFFARQEKFVNIDYSGKKVAYEQIAIPMYTPSQFSWSQNKDKEEWNERWGDVHKLYKLKPQYTSEHSWDSDNQWSGWCFSVIEKDMWDGFSEYLVYPYQVATKKQSDSWMYSYMPSVQEAVNEAFDFHTNNDLSSYKQYITHGKKVDHYDVCSSIGEKWSDRYFFLFSYDDVPYYGKGTR